MLVLMLSAFSHFFHSSSNARSNTVLDLHTITIACCLIFADHPACLLSIALPFPPAGIYFAETCTYADEHMNIRAAGPWGASRVLAAPQNAQPPPPMGLPNSYRPLPLAPTQHRVRTSAPLFLARPPGLGAAPGVPPGFPTRFPIGFSPRFPTGFSHRISPGFGIECTHPCIKEESLIRLIS